MLEDVLGDAIVEHALAFDHLVLLGIEGGGIVLEVLNQCSGLGSFIQNLRLALVDTATAAHRCVPWLEKVHDAVAPVTVVTVRGGGTWGCGTRLENCGGRPSATDRLAERVAEYNRHRPASRPAQRRLVAVSLHCLDGHQTLCKAARDRPHGQC